MRDSESITSRIAEAERYLADCDPRLAQLIDQHGPCTLISTGSLFHKTAFHALAWSIINQQLSVASARSIERKLLGLHKGKQFQRRTIDTLTDDQLRACGLSRQKIRYLRVLCDSIDSGALETRRLPRLADEEVAERLTGITGIGPWTADMYLMFYLARLDVLPLGDLALRNAFAITYDLDDNNDTATMRDLAEPWAPYRSIATWYLWCVVD